MRLRTATLGSIQHRAAEDTRLCSDQLQTALESRVVFEEAKGVLAEHQSISMDQSFATLRHFARENDERLTDVALAVARREPGALAQIVQSTAFDRMTEG